MAGVEKPKEAAAARALARHAGRYPGVEIGAVCVNQAFQAGGKSFLFLGQKADSWNGRVKLTTSVSEAEKRASKAPDLYEVGKFGWVKFTFPNGKRPPKGLLERWVDESYRNLVPRKWVERLPARGFPGRR